MTQTLNGQHPTASAEDFADLVDGMGINPATIIDTPTAKTIAALLPGMRDYTGLMQQVALDMLRVSVGYLPEGEREELAPHLAGWLGPDQGAQFLASCPPPPGDPVFTFETLDDLFSRPDKQWLIESVIGAGDIGMLYGPPGSGKTFVVVDLIFSACLAQTWAMRFAVSRPLNVAYCAGEGISGLKERFRAAALRYEVTGSLPGFSFSALVPQLYSAGADAMAGFVAEWKGRPNAPALDLLVIDTLHAATVGADENSAQDMGRVLAAAKVASRELGCAVLLVHHSNKAGTGERGSSALRGAMDCMLEVGAVAGKYQLSCAKLKDGEAWKSQTFDLVAVEDCESVRVWWDEPSDGEPGDGRKSETGREILTTLADLDEGHTLTAKQIGEATGRKPQSVNDVLARLVRNGLVERSQNGRNALAYAITETGKDALQNSAKVI